MTREPCPLPNAYTHSAEELPVTALQGDVEARVVVIGGGISGASTALHIAQSGKPVALLESEVIGHGGSGRAYGLLVAYAKLGHKALLERFGHDRGSRLVSALASGPDRVFELINRHNIECSAQHNGWILGAHKPGAAAELESRANYWSDQGAPVNFLGEKQTAELTGSKRYTACLFDKRSGGLNPLAYTRGLAIAAQTAGASIYQHSAVSRIEPGVNARWRVKTANGFIEADQVVHCTNAYTDKLWPGLKQSIIPLRAYALVTEPLSETLQQKILPGGQIMTDTRHLFSGIRKLPDGRIHLSTSGSVLNVNGKPNKIEAEKRLLHTFPEIGKVNWSEQWTAWVGVTKDQLPKIYRLADGMWAIQGYSGRGITFATLLGGEMQKLIENPKRDDLILPVEALKPIPFHRFAPLGASALVAWYSLLDSL